MGEPLICETALPDETATVELAGQLAAALPDPAGNWLIALQGELGAGKSTFARAMLRRYGHDGPVPSPTYTLVEPYDFHEFCIYHIGVYRISSPDELEFLGWSDLADGLRMVEWPERVQGLTEEADIRIVMRYADEGRRAELVGMSPRGAEILKGMNLN